jgi:anaerobic magnesium-protoporphyrin IX monomethyl ester cyclase
MNDVNFGIRTTMRKKILFLNPAKNDSFVVDRIHMGFTLLGQLLTQAGHDVKVLDYAFLKAFQGRFPIPTVREVLSDFKPDVVGISVFTYLYAECHALIEEVSSLTEVPILLGGPHITLFPEDFSYDSRVSYLVCGEAETVITDIIDRLEKKTTPEVVHAQGPAGTAIPAVNLDIAHGSTHLKNYQIQLSRGCPYSCSFCNVEFIAGGRTVRVRNLDTCIDEIREAKRRYPNIQTFIITDDCPNFDRGRFKTFLLRFAELETGCSLHIDNVRADLVDEEMLRLYIRAGGTNICLGTESGDAEVFRLVNKGESLDALVKAIQLVKKFNLSLGLCFVIGLPEDSLGRFRRSLELARSVKPDYVFWNMCTPWPCTPVYEWFITHGVIGDVRGFSTLVDPEFNFSLPRAWSNDFSREDRVRAWLIANMETFAFPFSSFARFFSNIPTLLNLARQYGLYAAVCKYIVSYIPHHAAKALAKRLVKARAAMHNSGNGDRLP